MAIIKLGTIVVGIRGTIGGVTFSANRAGPYAKSWTYPRTPNNALQQFRQADLSRLPTAWRALTTLQRAAWDTFAAAPAQQLTNSLGQTYFISGFQWFMKINLWKFAVSQTVQPTAPVAAKPTPPTISTLTVNSSPALARITYPAGTFPAGHTVLIILSQYPSTGLAAPAGFFKVTGFQLNPSSTTFTFTGQFLFIQGNPNAGYTAFARVYDQNAEGYRSAPTNINVQIA